MITHSLLELKPLNEALVYSIEKFEYTGQRLIKWAMDERTSWIKLQHLHILQIGSSSWQDQVELTGSRAGTFCHSSIAQRIYEEEEIKFKALILKPEDLLVFHLGLISSRIPFFMIKAMN